MTRHDTSYVFICSYGSCGSNPRYPEPKIAAKWMFIPQRGIGLIQPSWWQITTDHDEHMTVPWPCHDTLRASHAYPQRVVHVGPHLGEGERRECRGTTRDGSEMPPPTTSNAIVGLNSKLTGGHKDCKWLQCVWIFECTFELHALMEHLSFWQWNLWQRLEAIPRVNTKAGYRDATWHFVVNQCQTCFKTSQLETPRVHGHRGVEITQYHARAGEPWDSSAVESSWWSARRSPNSLASPGQMKKNTGEI